MNTLAYFVSVSAIDACNESSWSETFLNTKLEATRYYNNPKLSTTCSIIRDSLPLITGFYIDTLFDRVRETSFIDFETETSNTRQYRGFVSSNKFLN